MTNETAINDLKVLVGMCGTRFEASIKYAIASLEKGEKFNHCSWNDRFEAEKEKGECMGLVIEPKPYHDKRGATEILNESRYGEAEKPAKDFTTVSTDGGLVITPAKEKECNHKCGHANGYYSCIRCGVIVTESELNTFFIKNSSFPKIELLETYKNQSEDRYLNGSGANEIINKVNEHSNIINSITSRENK